MKRGIVDNMRLPSRPYRFEFESNEDEERAIAEAIAREEELMRQEEESKRGQNRTEHHWQHPRIINQYGQVGTNLFSQLSKQPLNYSSNLMPSKDDSPEQKSIKQMLDTIITQVCRWDKQHGWYKSHLKRPRNRFELDKLRSRRMFSNQREVMLAQHVDRLRKEINKRRTALENQAEEGCGLLTPWRKSKGRGQKVPKRQHSPEQEAPRQVVNPAEISLGGDAVKWTEPRSIKKEEILDENFLQDVDVENLIEVQSPQRRTERRSTTRWSPQPPKSPKKLEKLRKVKDEPGFIEESRAVASPRRRGRPPKRPYDSTDGISDDSDGGGRKKVRRPPPQGMDINALHCLCQKRYNPFRFYLACNNCGQWYHGKCVGISEDDIDNLTSWTCPHCDIPKQVPLYCKCQTEYNESEFYVGCDGCQGWFHPKCVGISRETVEKIPEYLCPECSLARDNAEGSRQDDDYDSADSDCNNRTPLNRSDYPILWKLYEVLYDHRMAWPFRQPITEDEYPEYSKIILKPIDLSVIQKQLEDLEYHTLDEFADDVRLMFQNARTYFKEGTVAICADSLEKLFETQLSDAHNQIESRRMQDRRKASESRTIDSSLDIDTDQLMDVDLVDPSMYEQLL
ncbi:unnamed protein product [Auanema sp. JU1783]|nr:unnamed protein product [Auanema sp. JU1783]